MARDFPTNPYLSRAAALSAWRGMGKYFLIKKPEMIERRVVVEIMISA
jgi:hypothetical protein